MLFLFFWKMTDCFSREDPYLIGDPYFYSTEESHNLALGWVNNQAIFTEKEVPPYS